ncbi:MAG: phage tail tape measure protein [Paracoccaceae bacterium]|nr:phage tail tape measure protein [Paracoccaceae bacterium]
MSDFQGRLEDLDAQIAGLDSAIGDTREVSAAFRAELGDMRDTMRGAQAQVEGLSRSLGRGLRSAFDGLVFDGARLSDALRMVGRSMANAAYGQAMRPVQNALGGAIAGMMGKILPFADGGVFSQGHVVPFARGGVVSGATPFAMRGATGVMGEAGPEAIMPLSRGPDGRLGVRAEGGGRPVQVVINVSTPDVEGFRRSRSQIAAEMARAIERGARNR